MVDNSTTPPTGLPVASDDISGSQYQRIKLTLGADGINDGDISLINPMPVKFVTDNLGLGTSANQTTIISRLAQFYAEDTAHVSGNAGYMFFAVRSDTNVSLVDATGDYAPLQVDALGRLKVISSASSVLPATTDKSGSITNGGTQQTLAAANTNRLGLTVQNTSSGDERVREDGGSANSTTGYLLPPGSSANINSNKAISIWGATTGQTFASTEW